MAGWITVVITICYILMGLVPLWWKSGRVAETIDDGTQMLAESRCSQDVHTRIMVTKHGSLWVGVLIAIQTTHEKSALGCGALGYENKF